MCVWTFLGSNMKFVIKCKFGYTELKLLGNIINGHGIKPKQKKAC